MNDVRLLTVCPTRIRARICRRMIESVYATRINERTQVYCYVDEQDPQKNDYASLFTELNVPHKFGPRLTVVQAFNAALTIPAPYYGVMNDDFVYHTPHWDALLIEAIEKHGGNGMAYGKTKSGIPTAAVFSAASIHKLGWWFPAEFKHQYVDCVQFDIFNGAQQAYYVPEVWVEHVRHEAGTAGWDANYEWVYSRAVHEHDQAAYNTWLATRKAADIALLETT